MNDEKNLVTEEEAAQYRLQYLQKFLGLSEEESRTLVAVLTQSTPKDWIQERPIRGGGTAKYVPGYRFIQKFNDAFGFLWSQEFPELIREGNEVISKGRWSLQVPGRTVTRTHSDGMVETVRFDGFSVVKEQYGSAEIKRYAQNIFAKDKKGNTLKDANGKDIIRYKQGDVMDLGNDFKAASTDAMKKCGTELGMFLDVYGTRETAENAGPTDTQLQAFYKRASDISKNEEEANAWAAERLGKPLKEAKQQEVLGLVADLIDIKKEEKK